MTNDDLDKIEYESADLDELWVIRVDALVVEVRALRAELERFRQGIVAALGDGETPEQKLLDAVNSGLPAAVLATREYFRVVDALWALLGHKDESELTVVKEEPPSTNRG